MGTAMRALMGGIMAAWALAAAAPVSADQGHERKLRQSCERGERGACIALGTLLSEPYSPSEDRPRAIALLRPVCDNPASLNEMAETCANVGEMLLVERTLDPDAIDPVMVDTYLARACDAGSRATCGTLAAELESGELMAGDAPRARRLRERLCRGGEQRSCDALNPPPEPAPDVATARVEEGAIIGQDQEVAFADLPPLEPAGQAGDASPDTVGEADQGEIGGTLMKVDPFDQPRIVRVNRGTRVKPGYANWVAMIWRPEQVGGRKLKPWGRMLCGGTLIAPGWVLTAAHCLDDEIGRVSSESRHTIRLGAFNPLNLDEGNTYPIRQVIANRAFNPRTYAWDIALIQFDETRPTRGKVWGKIQPVAVDARPVGARSISANLPVNVLGWGRTSPDNPNAAEALMEGKVTLLNEDACTEETFFEDSRKDSVLCAAARIGQHNCKGDSGGPLVLDDRRRNRKVLLGVISMAQECGDGTEPSRFVRVTQRAVWAWILKHLPTEARRQMTLAVE
jgi:V8-like Glu-specific endopeptidase